MILFYYRGKDGAITQHHGLTEHTEGLTLDQLKGLVQEYNEQNVEKGKTAYIEELADDSLTAYLAQKAAERKKLDKEVIQDAISSIEEALDSVRSLEGWT